ncbi:4579_t:CDS:1, partial [Gigaspora rosea]
ISVIPTLLAEKLVSGLIELDPGFLFFDFLSEVLFWALFQKKQSYVLIAVCAR